MHGNKGRKFTPEHRHKIKVANSRRIQTQEHINKRIKYISKDWIVTWPDGHTELVTNLHKWAKEHGMNSQNLGRLGQSKGFTCEKL